MVVFDAEDCFSNAVNTAILMNTVSQKIINKHFSQDSFTCGIGIDYGKMMIAKCGTVKYGAENSHYKSLVWIGRPANIASKLTDKANKAATSAIVSGLNAGFKSPYSKDWYWKFQTPDEFVSCIQFSYLSPNMKYNDDNFKTCFATTQFNSNSDATPPILISKAVFEGFKKSSPEDASMKNGWWRVQKRSIDDYGDDTYGGNITFTV